MLEVLARSVDGKEQGLWLASSSGYAEIKRREAEG